MFHTDYEIVAGLLNSDTSSNNPYAALTGPAMPSLQSVHLL